MEYSTEYSIVRITDAALKHTIPEVVLVSSMLTYTVEMVAPFMLGYIQVPLWHQVDAPIA